MIKQLLSHSKWVSVWVIFNFIATLSGNHDSGQVVQTKQSQDKPVLTAATIMQNHMSIDRRTLPKLKSAREPKSVPVQVSYKYKPDLNHDLQKYVAIEVVATGYYAGKESTGKDEEHPDYGVTYSGVKVIRDEKSFSTIAADPKVFPIGSVLYIPGYGYGIVADTGSAIKGKKIDLYFETKDQVYKEWGKKKLNIFLVKKGAGKLNKTIWNESESELFPVARNNRQPELRVNGNET